MKKNLLFFPLLIASSLYGDGHVYFGTGIAYANEKLDSSDKSIINTQKSMKIGYGMRDSYAVEFALDYTPNNKTYFAADDGRKYGFSVDLIKAYDFGIFINPYLKLGFGAGALKTNADANTDSLTYGTFNTALGFFIPLSPRFDIELAYQYKFVSYEKIDLTASKSPSSSLNLGYLGFNIRF